METNSAGRVHTLYVTSAKEELFAKVYKMKLGGIGFTLPNGPAKVEAPSFDYRQMALIRALIDNLSKIGDYIRKTKKVK